MIQECMTGQAVEVKVNNKDEGEMTSGNGMMTLNSASDYQAYL